MGANLGAKSAAIGLMALAGGNRKEAERLWEQIRHGYPNDMAAALDLVEEALSKPARIHGSEESQW